MEGLALGPAGLAMMQYWSVSPPGSAHRDGVSQMPCGKSSFSTFSGRITMPLGSSLGHARVPRATYVASASSGEAWPGAACRDGVLEMPCGIESFSRFSGQNSTPLGTPLQCTRVSRVALSGGA